MAEDVGVIIGSFLVWIIMINGFSAGMAAALHIWRAHYRLRSRIVLSAVLTGVVPSSMIVVVVGAANDATSGGAEWVVGLTAMVTVMLAITAVLSLPGAIVVSRKLAGGGNAYRNFE